MTIIEEIAAERERQKSAEGWTEVHDDKHTDEGLALAAACYAAGSSMARRRDEYPGGTRTPKLVSRRTAPVLWPWAVESWNPKGPRRNLVRAAALIVAEIERIDRASRRQA